MMIQIFWSFKLQAINKNNQYVDLQILVNNKDLRLTAV